MLRIIWRIMFWWAESKDDYVPIKNEWKSKEWLLK
jgi:hypothetical protein